MARTQKTVITSDLTGAEVEESEAVEIVVLEGPGLKRAVRLDAAPSEVEGLETTAKPLYRITIDGQPLTIEETRFKKMLKNRELAEVLADAKTVNNSPKGPLRRRTSNSPTTSREELQAMRDWARANGFEVADRGRISREIRDAYAAR